ncbi:hypothetical protein pdul_cds_431 [Pandoravirus dulcis]|uniref:Atrophin-1 incomplete domain containing protein n=1 Tax=Pandoravirus dulcis TaxID=1349409 RepID=S4VQ89_9VIRU|nr:hypothetical protein pdul_cds_431 [Pandoravirus dulcis]AGO82488.1 hypothetical protein pdul_cds_431 [Pandoravirus dulcis]
MEAPARLPYNAIEQAVLARGLDDFTSLGPTEMLFFLCDALASDPDVAANDLAAPFMYYYERAVAEARARSAEQREAAAGIGIPEMDGPGGNLAALAVFMFLAQTDFAGTIDEQMDAWAAANGADDPRASNEALATALAGVLALERPLPPPDAGEPLDAYYQRVIPAGVTEYLFRLNGRDEAQAPWPYYRLVIGAPPPPSDGDGDGDGLLYRWWWLDPLAYFSLPEGGADLPADLVADAVSRMVVGLLPIAGDTPDAQVANWQRDYDPRGYPWSRAPALGSAGDPCARARGDLNAVGLSAVVVGPNQAAAAEAPLAAALAPAAAIVGAPSPRPQQPQRPPPTAPSIQPTYRPSAAGFSVFEAPPTPLPTVRQAIAQEQQQQQQIEGPRAVSAKRRRDALDAGALAAAAMGPDEAARYPTPANIALATLGRVNPLARQPIEAVRIEPPSDVCLICPRYAIPSDVLDYLAPDWNAWEAAGGTAEDYRERVLDLIDDYQRNAPAAAPTSPTAEPVSRRRRLSREPEEEAQSRRATGVGNVVAQVLGDAGLVNAYGVGPLLGMIDAWSTDPGASEFYSAFIQGQSQAVGTVCRECALRASAIYAEEQERAPRATIAGARMTFPFAPLPGLPVVVPAERGAFPGPFILAGSVPVGTLAPYRLGATARTIQPGEEVVTLGGATRATGYQIRQTWFDYFLGPYGIERGALVFYRPETHLFEAALAPGAPPLPLALGRVVEYDTSHFDVVLSLGPEREALGFFPTRLVVQPLLAGVEAGVVESVRTDSAYPYAAGAQVPTSQQVLEARGAPVAAQFAGGPVATEAARAGGPGLVAAAAAAQNLLEQRAALAEALASPALSAASGDAERVRRLYLEIDERVRALGLGGERPTSLPALQRAVRLAGRESARQRPSSRVLAAAGRTGGGPSARASLELAAAGATGDIGAARANLEAALASIEAGVAPAGPRGPGAIVGVTGAPPSPGLLAPAGTAPAAPGEVVVDADGQEHVLVDERSKWDVLFAVVLTKFGVLYPQLALDVDRATASLLLAASLLGYAVPLTVAQVARLTDPGPRPGPQATADQRQAWDAARGVQDRAVARQRAAVDYINSLPAGTVLTARDTPNLGAVYATLFQQAWNSIFDQEGLTTAARDQEALRDFGRRLWAYPGAPNTLVTPAGSPAVFASRPDRALPSAYAASALAASGTDPNLGRLRDIILEPATRYRWSDVFAGPSAALGGRRQAPSEAVDVGATLRSREPGAGRGPLHAFRPPPARAATGVGAFVSRSTAYGRSLPARMFPAAAAAGGAAPTPRPPARAPARTLASRGLSATARTAPPPAAATATLRGRLAQDNVSTALLQNAYIYRAPGSFALRVVVDPVTAEGLRAGQQAALDRLGRETARVTRPVPGSLGSADLVVVPGTNDTLHQITGPTRGSDPNIDWLRPSTVGVRDLLRSVVEALNARGAGARPS